MKKKLKNLITDLFLFGEGDEPGATPPEPPVPPEDESKKKYIETIDHLKKTMVPKERLDRLEEENKMLLNSIIDGGELPKEITDKLKGKDAEPTVQSLREDLFGENRKEMSNLETAQKMMKLRRTIIEETGEDPAVSVLRNPTKEDAERAEEAAQLIEYCIEQANGNSAVFTSLLQSHMVDDKLLAASLAAKRQNKKRPN